MLVSLIVAMDLNRVIGNKNDLPWRLPKDWQYLKETTMGHPLIMGRKNFDSIGKPLPGRRNIVLTRDQTFLINGCEIAHSIEEVFHLCKTEEEIFIFGGEQIYKLFLPYVQKMYITKIHHEFKGDTFFPIIHFDEWNEIYKKNGITDKENPFIYSFHIYERI
ncbi:dihydrofolate reductase [Heyndrickxia sporothermodurans]